MTDRRFMSDRCFNTRPPFSFFQGGHGAGGASAPAPVPAASAPADIASGAATGVGAAPVAPPPSSTSEVIVFFARVSFDEVLFVVLSRSQR